VMHSYAVRDEQPLEGSSVTWMAQQEVGVT
jgi:hypothetical protein